MTVGCFQHLMCYVLKQFPSGSNDKSQAFNHIKGKNKLLFDKG